MKYEIASSRVFPGSAWETYAILSDYRHGHPSIMPSRYFSRVQVLDGGTGEGTELRFDIRSFGKTRPVWAVITEPDPGRVLTETDLLSGTQTCFEVEEAGDEVSVTIRSRLAGRAGALGRLERYLTTVFLRRVFDAELRLLERAVSGSYGRSAGEEGNSVDLPGRRWSTSAAPPELSADSISRFVEAP